MNKKAPLLLLPGSLRRCQVPAAGGHGEASTRTSHLHRQQGENRKRHRQVNEPSSFSTQNLSGAQKIREFVERYYRCDDTFEATFELNLKELGMPIGPITLQRSWARYLGRPIKQENGTCVLVSCTIAVDAAHRRQQDGGLRGGVVRMHGAHPKHPDEWLLDACVLAGIWEPSMGVCHVGLVLNKIQQMGGVPVLTTNAPEEFLLPLHSWEGHAGGELTPKHVAALMDRHGPCVGLLWLCPWYGYFDTARDGGTLVYRGCGRSQVARSRSEEDCGRDEVGWHAVVCYEYRFCGEEMHVLVLDNQSENGPRRWVHVNELNALYTLHV